MKTTKAPLKVYDAAKQEEKGNTHAAWPKSKGSGSPRDQIKPPPKLPEDK
jgi:hypothetical protein